MKLKALVVDDSRVMRNMVASTLQATGLAEFEYFERRLEIGRLEPVEHTLKK